MEHKKNSPTCWNLPGSQPQARHHWWVQGDNNLESIHRGQISKDCLPLLLTQYTIHQTTICFHMRKFYILTQKWKNSQSQFNSLTLVQVFQTTGFLIFPSYSGVLPFNIHFLEPLMSYPYLAWLIQEELMIGIKQAMVSITLNYFDSSTVSKVL